MIAGSKRIGVAAGLPLFNFGMIKGKQREVYFAAVQAGMSRNYKPMQEIFRRVVQASN
jgi:cell filamentation protein